MKRKPFILSLAPVALIAVMALSGCDGSPGGGNTPSPTQAQEAQQTNAPDNTPTPDTSPSDTPAPDGGVQDIGQGDTLFLFECTDGTQTTAAWNVRTDETTVGKALLGVGLIAGEPSDMGLMVQEVNGLKADYEADQSWWAFYIDGEMAVTGVDATDIDPDKTYAFVYTKG